MKKLLMTVVSVATFSLVLPLAALGQDNPWNTEACEGVDVSNLKDVPAQNLRACLAHMKSYQQQHQYELPPSIFQSAASVYNDSQNSRPSVEQLQHIQQVMAAELARRCLNNTPQYTSCVTYP